MKQQLTTLLLSAFPDLHYQHDPDLYNDETVVVDVALLSSSSYYLMTTSLMLLLVCLSKKKTKKKKISLLFLFLSNKMMKKMMLMTMASLSVMEAMLDKVMTILEVASSSIDLWWSY